MKLGESDHRVLASVRSAKQMGLLSCRTCHQIHVQSMEQLRCVQCGRKLQQRKTNSVTRSWMLLVAAMLAYFPAILFPITVIQTSAGKTNSAIISRVIDLWLAGDGLVALLMLATSVMFPLTKIVSLAVLLLSVERRSIWHLRKKTRLFRFLEIVSRWTMLDVFVVILLTSFVQAGNIAKIIPGPGILSFSAVVLLTMIASRTFDSRLLWDSLDE
jgi:paraquat-inducible protein A